MTTAPDPLSEAMADGPSGDDARYKDDPLYQMMTDAPATPGAAPGPAAPGPAAPAQPGPPRAVARLPPPAPKAPGAPPGAIVDAKEDLSLPAVVGGALTNYLPSAVNSLGQMVKPLVDWQGDAQAFHTLTTNPGAVWDAVKGVYGPRYDLMHPFREGGILQTLKHDPAAIQSDVGAIASIPAGGELLEARLPGVMGDVAGIAGKVGRAGQYLDPAYAATQAVGKPVAALLRHPDVARSVGKLVGGTGGGIAGLVSPIPGSHAVTGFLGERLGELGGELVARGATKLAQNPIVQRGVKTAEGLIPAVHAGAGMLPQTPGEQASSPGGASGAPGSAPTGGPELEPQYANDPLYQMMMGAGGGEAQAATPAPPSASPGAPLPAPRGAMYGHIANVAQQAGANDGEIATLQQIARVESSGNPGASSPSGRYHGLFQYHDSAGPDQDTVRALGDLRHNEERLRGMGVTPDAGALYVMHQQGPGGGPALLTAPPGTKAIDAIARYYGSRAIARQAIAHNIGYKYATPDQEAAANAAAENMTAADFVNFWRNRLSGVPFASGGRVERAEGGNVVSLTDRLMARAEREGKASRSATKPLLALDDNTVAKALAVANRAI